MSTPTAATQFDASTNRLQQESSGQPLPPGAYDAQGNLTNHPWIGQMSYDGEGKIWRHIKGGTTVEFTYDGEGRRVKKRVGTAPPTIYVYDAAGQLAADYGTADGTLGCSTCYITADHLGSTRLTTGATGDTAGRLDYFPFGETIPGGASFGNRPSPPTGPRQKFTGKERDAETGLDYFGARYFSGAQGRFTSADAPFADQFPADPQSWNVYIYARNNPLRLIDLTGEAVIESRKVQTYRVQGRTAAEAFANSRQVSGIKSVSGEAMSGLTSWRMGILNMRIQDSVYPGNALVSSSATSELVSADVKLDQTITLPEWSDRASASPEEQAAWDAALGELKQHEEQHVSINREQAEKLDRSLPGTRGSAQAPIPGDAQRKARADLSGKIGGKVRRNNEETIRRQRRLDEETDHGRRPQ